MSKIFIEKKEIKFKLQETIEDTRFDIVDGKYVENTKLNRKYISDIYPYVDFNVLFAMENLFDQYYIKIILFNDEKKIGYNLISLSNGLDISVKRISPKNFLVLGVNKDQEVQGQASFCTLQDDASVSELTINFNYINQYKVIQKNYFLLNFIEVFGGNSETSRKEYATTIAVYRADGSIVKILFDEKDNFKRDVVCDIENDDLVLYYKDDGSIIKRMTIPEILITGN